MSSIFRSSKTILIHGMEADWIEEEISDGDGEFLKDVLEQKVLTAFTSAGIQKKVERFFWGHQQIFKSATSVILRYLFHT